MVFIQVIIKNVILLINFFICRCLFNHEDWQQNFYVNYSE